MSGLAGSFDLEKAYKLYKQNIERGSDESSSIVISDECLSITRSNKPFDKQQTREIKNSFYLFHSRAHTHYHEINKFEESHPFHYVDWIVLHNGTINNFYKLKQQFTACNQKTDSSIVPILLHNLTIWDDVVSACRFTCNRLEGIFSLWMYNLKFNRMFLACSGAALYVNNLTGDVSSTKSKDMKLLEHGKIFEIEQDSRKIVEVDQFNQKPDYFLQ